MKRHTLNISTVSVLCVLCTGLAGNAMAAGSVRTLGGTGTFDGTSAASTATRSVSSTRAGSLRVSPSSARLVTSAANTSGNKASGTATSGTTQRLSIGKYLGETVTTPAAPTSDGTTPASTSTRVRDLEDRIGDLEEVVGTSTATPAEDSLAGRITQLETTKATSSQDGVVIVDENTGEVSIDVGELMSKLETEGAILDAHQTEIKYEDDKLQWRYTTGDDTEWHVLLNIATLMGDYATSDELSNEIDGLASVYLTQQSAAETYQRLDNLTTELTASSTDTQYPSAKAVYDATKDLATAANVYTKTAADDKFATQTALGTLSDTVDTKANASDVYTKTAADDKFATQTALGTLSDTVDTKANASDVYTKTAADDKFATQTALGTLSGRVDDLTSGGEGSVATQIATAIGELGEGVTVKDALDTKANASDVYTKTAADDKFATQTALGTLSDAVDTKANASDVYTKTAADDKFATQTAVNEALETVNGSLDAKANSADLGALAALDAVGSSQITDNSITNADIATGAAIDQSKISGLTTALENKADTSSLKAVATSGSFGDLIEVGTLPSIDGREWVWGYVNGEPQFIRVVGADGN